MSSEAPPSAEKKEEASNKESTVENKDVKSIKVEDLPKYLHDLKSGANEKEAAETAAKLEEGMQKFFITDEAKQSDTPEHKFWGTQPVPANEKNMVKDFNKVSEIESKEEKLKILSKTPVPLPKDLEWFDVDLNDKKMLKDTHDLLAEHYVEDSDSWFRFDYSAESISWATSIPGTFPEWRLGIRSVEGKVMLGFISAVPQRVFTKEKIVECVVIDFLCVHKQLRSKRLAPLLIKEITRRVNLRGIFQAIYTGLLLLLVLSL